MKKCIVIVFLLLAAFSFSSCRKREQNETVTTKEPTTVINNIYITDHGIFTDMPSSLQNITVSEATVPSAEVAESVSVTPPTQAAENKPLELSQYTPQMILDHIVEAINSAKAQQNFSAHQLQQVTINLTDCTLSWAVPIINGAIGVFNGPHDFDYTFVNGECADPKEDFKTTATPMSAIPPSDRLFALTAEGIVDSKAYEENGEYVYTVTLPYEYTNAEVAVPKYHAMAMDYLDLGDFDFGIGEITDANCYYPGATVTVRTATDGTLLKYEETIPMYGSGTGKLGISLSASFEGSMYECWTFEW